MSLTPSALGAVKAMLLDLDAAKAEALLRPLVENPPTDGTDPREARSVRRRRRAAIVTTLPEAKLDTLLTRHAAVEAELSRQLPAETFVKLSREFAEIDPVVAKIKAYREVAAELADLEALVADAKTEAAMREMADDERRALLDKRERMVEELRLALLPKDAMDERNVIVEIRAGTGGDEASLFAGDLFRMYERFAARQGWTTEIISAQRGHQRRLQGNHRRDQRPRAVRPAQVRIRRASRAAGAGYRGAGPRPHLGCDRRRAAGGRGRRHRDQAPTISRSTPCGPRAPAASTSTRPNRRSASPTCRAASS